MVIGITSSTPDASKIMEHLEKGRADMFHLRMPDASEEEMRRLIESISPEFHPHLRLHSHFSLVKDYGLGGVHLNSRWPDKPDFPTALSRSCHLLSELEVFCCDAIADTEPYRRDATEYEYVTLSPVYDSISKQRYRQRFSPKNPEVKEFLTGKARGMRVIALGGVTPDRFPELRDCGFSGAAMLGFFEC